MGGIVASVFAVSSCGDDASTDSDVAPAPIQFEGGLLDYNIVENGALASGLPVRYESFDSARLTELRERENLDAVIAGAHDEFEKMLLVKEWVAAQWPHSYPDPYPPWDAMVILDWIRSGKTGGYCAQYAMVLLQSYAALGFTARYVEIGMTDNPYAHVVIEVWSNQFDKWVVMDPDYNIHYERDGTPLGAIEVHDALVRSELPGLVVVEGAVRDGHTDPDVWPLSTAELYYYVRVHLKADHLTVTNEPEFDRYNDMVEWSDEHTVPWELSPVDSRYRKVALTNLMTGTRDFFEGRLNQVSVTIESTDERGLDLRFENNVLGFQTYQVREPGRRGAAGDWLDYGGSAFRWNPSPVAQRFEVRGVNTLGVAGPPAVVQVRFVPVRATNGGG